MYPTITNHFLTLLGGLVVELISTLVCCDTAFFRTGVRGLSEVLRTSCSLTGEDRLLTRGSELAPVPPGCRDAASVTRPGVLLPAVSLGRLGDSPESLVLVGLNSWLGCLLEKWKEKQVKAKVNLCSTVQMTLIILMFHLAIDKNNILT